MNPTSLTHEDKLRALTGAIALVTSLLTALQSLRGAFGGASHVDLLVLAGLLLLVGVVLLRGALTKRSRLVSPEALKLNPDHPTHLKGREDDVANLVRLCEQHRVVHLVGEAGVGKTALLRAGLLPRLKEHSQLVPIYVNTWGEDWEKGPAQALRAALLAALSPEQLKQTQGLPDEDVSALLRWVGDTFQRPLLLLFDNTDAYLSLHRERLLPKEKGAWLRSEELTALNGFWRHLAALVDEGRLRLVFSAETADSLQPLRFGATESYPLFRIAPREAGAAIAELTRAADEQHPVVLHPERGWTRLQAQLVRDLGQQGPVLPAELKLALQGLGTLSSLTPGEYHRVGRLHGLIVRLLTLLTEEVARSTGATQAQVLQVLSAVASDSRGRGAARSTGELIDMLNARGPSAQWLGLSLVTNILQALARAGLLHRATSAEASAQRWSLAYGQLHRAIGDAERDMNRWGLRLREAAELHAHVSHEPLSWWRTLLPPTTQLRLLVERLRGRFRYGAQRGFALLSLVRFSPFVLAALWLLWAADRKVAVPAGEELRRAIDRLGLSLYRQPEPLGSIRAKASARMKESQALIRARLDERTGWITGPPSEQTREIDPWAQCQALAAVYRTGSGDLAPFDKAARALFAPGTLRVIQGVNLGWNQGPGKDYPMALPALWCGQALARRIRLLRAEHRDAQAEEFFGYFQLATAAALNYRRHPGSFEGGWDLMPWQVEGSLPSQYASVLALQMLLDAREARLPVGDSACLRDELLRATHAWLIDRYTRKTPTGLGGWTATDEPGQEVQVGLSMQIFAALIRAEAEAGLPVPPHILADIPRHLTALAETDLPQAADTASAVRHGVEHRDEQGRVRLFRLDIHFLWHPWSLEAAARWYAWVSARQPSHPERYFVQRSLGTLMGEVPQAIERDRQAHTFQSAELTYSLGTVLEALGGEQEPLAQGP